ncbi:hypothetical protein MGG_16215 [Pyricularia oryzae 70-15]|uniref:Uncharacterized protein n=1 Tax=Pyricularia oryzae (strain 70-15 / ATCC MYA-4617 / FGSC 8958) TaxID=242507 RepID=G4MND7_PYRO7|nr:uncharacterized protein MGG_16215 [Pyricularia oryzae 70-15]EHA57051.1 hypothetical protein MGG_16215 [Pyricularia oryzae 70-15]
MEWAWLLMQRSPSGPSITVRLKLIILRGFDIETTAFTATNPPKVWSSSTLLRFVSQVWQNGTN